MNNMEKAFNTAVAILATFFTYLFGGWDLALKILITFMVLDYMTGVIYAYVIKTLNSEVGFRGLIKKCMILAVLIVGVELDRMLGNGGTWVFRTLVAYFYIANEGISLLENISNLGVPIPNKIKTALEQLNNDEDQEKEAEAKKEKIKEEISVLAKDCQRLTLQQIDVVKQIFERQTYIGNTTKICPICDKEVSISSNFCNRCGWTFPILYYIDGNNTYQLDEKQLSVARTNWRSINMVSELQTIKSNLEIENQRLQRSLLQATEDCKSMTENLKKNESAIQKAKIEIKQMQILNKESDSRIKELEFSIIESKKENEKIKNDLLDKEKRLLYSIEENKQLQKRLSDEQTKARKVQKEYENLLAEQKVKTQSQSKPIVPKQEVSYVNRSTNMASGNSSVVNSNKNKTFKNKNDVFGLVRSLCTGSLITLDTNIITAGLRIYPLIQILAKDYELTYSEKAISNLFTIGNLVNAIWERKTSTIPNTLPPAQKKRKFSSKNDVFNFVRPFCKGKLITLNTGFYVAEIQYADLRKALLEKYNINISEYSLRCHATVGKLIDSIWSEHIKYAL